MRYLKIYESFFAKKAYLNDGKLIVRVFVIFIQKRTAIKMKISFNFDSAVYEWLIRV